MFTRVAFLVTRVTIPVCFCCPEMDICLTTWSSLSFPHCLPYMASPPLNTRLLCTLMAFGGASKICNVNIDVLIISFTMCNNNTTQLLRNKYKDGFECITLKGDYWNNKLNSKLSLLDIWHDTWILLTYDPRSCFFLLLSEYLQLLSIASTRK